MRLKWKKKSQSLSSHQEDQKNKEMEGLEIRNEEEFMTQESKRKGNAMDGNRKPKKMKFLRLVNWGEDGGSTPSSQL